MGYFLTEEQQMVALEMLVAVILMFAFLAIGTYFGISWLSIKGRINRLPFFWRYIFSTLFMIKLGDMGVDVLSFPGISIINFFLAFIGFTVAIGFMVAVCTSLSMRRFQDWGTSGWWFIGINAVIKLIGIFWPPFNYTDTIILFFMFLKKGTEGPNKYGKAREVDDIF